MQSGNEVAPCTCAKVESGNNVVVFFTIEQYNTSDLMQFSRPPSYNARHFMTLVYFLILAMELYQKISNLEAGQISRFVKTLSL